MSIINEALKKTEEYLQKNSAKNTPAPHKPSKIKPLLFYVLILLAGILLGNFIFILLRHLPQGNGLPSSRQSHTPQGNGLPSSGQSQTESYKIQTTNSPSLPILPIQPPEEKILAPQANFVLNGIFFSDNDGYALVNNQIVREKDSVDGALVSLITANSVQLNNAGQTITLTTTR